MGDVLILTVIAAVSLLAIRSLLKNKKKGGCCGSCSGCSGNCGGCSGCGSK